MFLMLEIIECVGVEGRVGRLNLLLMKSTFHSVPFRAVFRRSKPGRVAREIGVVSVGSGRLSVGVEFVFPSLGLSSLFPVRFLLDWY